MRINFWPFEVGKPVTARAETRGFRLFVWDDGSSIRHKKSQNLSVLAFFGIW